MRTQKCNCGYMQGQGEEYMVMIKKMRPNDRGRESTRKGDMRTKGDVDIRTVGGQYLCTVRQEPIV